MWGLLIVGTGPAGVSAALTARAQIPALIQSGWFDDNGMGTTEALELVHNFPRGMRKVILGPWQHSDNSKYDMHGVSFGSQALRFDLDWLYFRWFEHHLKEVDNGIDQTAPVEYYTLGQEIWKTAENWPVPETRVTHLYLDSNGHANTSAGDGRLTFARPEQENSDGYAYDPEHPSQHIIDMIHSLPTFPVHSEKVNHSMIHFFRKATAYTRTGRESMPEDGTPQGSETRSPREARE